jgi:[protein-PII] uridylyltransferase
MLTYNAGMKNESITDDAALVALLRAKGQAAVARGIYQAARQVALTAFAHHNRIQPLWRALGLATDTLIAAIAASAPATVIAVGGYGRRELFPFSDIDILVLLPTDADDQQRMQASQWLQQGWDLQLPVSHATRTADETIAAALADHTIAAALMDARLICGDRKAYLALKKRLKHAVFGADARAFVAAKLGERDARHEKWGDSRFMLEPNIKEGKGGLRDLHTLTWLARYCYGVNKASDLVRDDLLTTDEWKHYRNAYVFFATVRAHMHLARGRADERLTFDMQTRLASQLHFRGRTPQEKAERFMRRYFQFARQVGALTRIFCALLEEENLRVPHAPFAKENLERNLPDGFIMDASRLHFSPLVDVVATPSCAVALFAEAQKWGVDIHPRAQLKMSRALPALNHRLPFEGEANRLFLEILLSAKAPDVTLRRMNETGILGALVPEFGRVVGMMQYDGYHTYTVDEHTIVAVGNLAMIESGDWAMEFPLASIVMQEVADRAPLYLAMLGHDLAKGSGGAHAEKGEAIVMRIATRLGLNAATSELTGWLVKHHLLLSETAFKRDLDDPQTIADFVAVVQSPERLRLLLLVTVADVKAVGPSIWNGWKGALMRDLYHRSMVQMGVGGHHTPPHDEVQRELLADLPRKLIPMATQMMQQRLPTSWWYRPRAEQIDSVRAYAQWRQQPSHPALVVNHDHFRAVSEVTCCFGQQPALFRTLAGVMAWIGASIVSARMLILADGAALATIGVQDMEGKSFASEHARLLPLATLIRDGLAGQLDFASELPKRRILSRGREVAIASSVFTDNQVSAQATVIEVNARDRLGLLYDMLGALEACQLQVMTAHIATYGKKAVDVFYVKDAYGIKIHHPAKLASVQSALLRASGGVEES